MEIFILEYHCFITSMALFNLIVLHITVTTVDSGSKALEFLGLYEDDQSNADSPSVSPNNQQVDSSP